MLTPYTYKDYRLYLHDWYWSAKKTNRALSFRAMSKRLGLKSPNHFHLVISQKRHFSTQMFDRVLRLIQVDKRASHFLKLLHQWELESNTEKRQRLMAAIQVFVEQSRAETQSTTEDLAVVGQNLAWYIKMGAALFEGLDIHSLKERVQKTCAFKLAEQDIDHGIRLLLEKKQLHFIDGKARFDHSSIKTKWDFDSYEIKNHHRSNLSLAQESVDWAINDRFLSSITILTDSALVDHAIAEIRALWLKLLKESELKAQDYSKQHETLISKDHPPIVDRQVVTFHLSMFPFFRDTKRPND